MERIGQQVCRTSANIVKDPGGDLIIIQGQLRFYRLFRTTGLIERVTDDAVFGSFFRTKPPDG